MQIKPTVYIKAGHTTEKPGASYNDLKEEALAIKVKIFVLDYLAQYDSLKLVSVPDHLTLIQAIRWINDRTQHLNDGLAIDIHFNSFQDDRAKGAEIYYYDGFRPSQKLADIVLDTYCEHTRLGNRGSKPDTSTRHGRLGFIRDTNPWALLMECAFLNGDYDYITHSGGLQAMGEGIAKGILEVYGIQIDNGAHLPVGDEKARIKKQIKKLVDQL